MNGICDYLTKTLVRLISYIDFFGERGIIEPELMKRCGNRMTVLFCVIAFVVGYWLGFRVGKEAL
jgi:hypothetical protein